MTGFGKATCEVENKKITIEIKSLNSKQLDLSTRVPNVFKEKDLELRNVISQRLERGKVDLSIYIENVGKETSAQLNLPIIEGYYNQIIEVSKKLNIPQPTEWFQTLLRMPDTMKCEMQEVDEEEWNAVRKTFDAAVDGLISFRKKEGSSLRNVFNEKISNISNLMVEIDPFEKERIEKIKDRIQDNLAKLQDIDFDKNRFEQELIYYIEKLDINEEKHRLSQHLTYFKETMDAEGSSGKKLGFIAQEIGREINTLGSKSNHSEMQKIVVKMKDELEQIKEQVLNVL